MSPLLVPLALLALFIAYRVGREDARHALEMEAERQDSPFLHFRGIRRKRLSEEPWATEAGKVERYRSAGML